LMIITVKGGGRAGKQTIDLCVFRSSRISEMSN
jgi:hypothetical protein